MDIDLPEVDNPQNPDSQVPETPPSPTLNGATASKLSSPDPILRPNSLSEKKSPSPKRVRFHPEKAKAPFEVFIRQIDSPINILLVSAESHKSTRP